MLGYDYATILVLDQRTPYKDRLQLSERMVACLIGRSLGGHACTISTPNDQKSTIVDLSHMAIGTQATSSEEDDSPQ